MSINNTIPKSRRTCKHGLKACEKCRLDLVDRRHAEEFRRMMSEPLPAHLVALVAKAVRS